MGGVVASIFGGGAGALTGGIASIINSIKGRNPEDAAKLQELMSKHEDLIVQTQADLEKAQRDENVKLNEIAGQNVRADAQSGDKWNARARPGVIWCGIVVLLINYGVIPFLQKYGFKPLDFPVYFWETWGVVTTGVVFTRTVDKAAQTALGGLGGSFKGFGLNIDSKGDK